MAQRLDKLSETPARLLTFAQKIIQRAVSCNISFYVGLHRGDMVRAPLLGPKMSQGLVGHAGFHAEALARSAGAGTLTLSPEFYAGLSTHERVGFNKAKTKVGSSIVDIFSPAPRLEAIVLAQVLEEQAQTGATEVFVVAREFLIYQASNSQRQDMIAEIVQALGADEKRKYTYFQIEGDRDQLERFKSEFRNQCRIILCNTGDEDSLFGRVAFHHADKHSAPSSLVSDVLCALNPHLVLWQPPGGTSEPIGKVHLPKGSRSNGNGSHWESLDTEGVGRLLQSLRASIPSETKPNQSV